MRKFLYYLRTVINGQLPPQQRYGKVVSRGHAAAPEWVFELVETATARRAHGDEMARGLGLSAKTDPIRVSIPNACLQLVMLSYA